MGNVNERVERSDIVEGDHIYSSRTLNIYSHHGIYIGDGLVIHFTAPPEKLKASSPFSSLSSSSKAPGQDQQRTCPNHPRCESQKPGVAIICLDCFRKERFLYRYKYGVKLFQLIWFRQGGTCTDDQSDRASTVLRRANYLLENGFGNYHLERNNCEDFALYCKTGILKIDDKGVGRSGQIIARSLKLASRIAMRKTASRRDLIKVPVEDMDKYHRHQIAALSRPL